MFKILYLSIIALLISCVNEDQHQMNQVYIEVKQENVMTVVQNGHSENYIFVDNYDEELDSCYKATYYRLIDDTLIRTSHKGINERFQHYKDSIMIDTFVMVPHDGYYTTNDSILLDTLTIKDEGENRILEYRVVDTIWGVEVIDSFRVTLAPYNGAVPPLSWEEGIAADDFEPESNDISNAERLEFDVWSTPRSIHDKDDQDWYKVEFQEDCVYDIYLYSEIGYLNCVIADSTEDYYPHLGSVSKTIMQELSDIESNINTYLTIESSYDITCYIRVGNGVSGLGDILKGEVANPKLHETTGAYKIKVIKRNNADQ